MRKEYDTDLSITQNSDGEYDVMVGFVYLGSKPDFMSACELYEEYMRSKGLMG